MEWKGYTAYQEAQRNYIEHYGTKGMKWRRRKIPNVYGTNQTSGSNNPSGSGNSMITSAGQSTGNAVSSATSKIQEQIHPTSTYKEAKKSKRFSFFSDILSKLKKLFG